MKAQMNQLLYDIALFNFSQFMIRDFDIKQRPTFTTESSALQISGFEKMDDAEWYCGMLKKDDEIQASLTSRGVRVVCITQTNADMLSKQLSIDDYLQWKEE